MMLGDGGVVEDLDALVRERAPDVDVDGRVVRHEPERALADGRELLLGRPPVGGSGDLAGLDLLAQAGDAHLEELVEVAGEDRQELDPLEQRVSFIARLVQDTSVEFQPRQFTVQIRKRRLRSGGASRAWRGGEHRQVRLDSMAAIAGFVSSLRRVADVERPGPRG